jgi:hypothetical protein
MPLCFGQFLQSSISNQEKNMSRVRSGVRLAPAVALLVAAAWAQGTILLDVSSALTASDPTFSRTDITGTFPSETCDSSLSGNFFYKTFNFTAIAGAPINIRATGSGGAVYLDTFVAVYTPSFNPGAPLTNCVGANDDDNGPNNDSYVQVLGPAAGAYTVVVTSFDTTTQGDFRLCVTQTTDELADCPEAAVIATPLPALTEWGVGGLIALLGLASTWGVRRRRTR